MNKAILYSKFVRYEVMNTLFNQHVSTRCISSLPINLYIDIQSVYKQALSENLIPNDVKVLSINVLNMAAHYRHYFRKKFGSEIRVFIVNSNKNENYNLYQSLNNQNSDSMFKIIKVLAPYFHNVYYLSREGFNATSIIYDIINRNPNNHVHFIISNDIYSYQLTALCNNCFVLRPSTNPKLVTYFNSIESWYSRKSSIDVSDLHPALLSLIMALNKCPELNIPTLYNMKNTLYTIRQMINSSYILNGYNTPIDLVMFKNNDIDVFNRWNLCDLVTQSREYSNSLFACDESWMISKKCDFKELSHIIDKNFNYDADNILNFIYLLD